MIITISLSKGGVGKSTTAATLAWNMAEAHKVLLVDMDPQGAAASMVLPVGTQPRSGLVDLMGKDSPLHRCIQLTRHPHIDLLAIGATDQSKKLGQWVGPEGASILGRALRSSGYGRIVIDTPPSDQWAQEIALSVADLALIPVQVDPLALAALGEFIKVVNTVARRRDGALKWAIVPTMHDQVTITSREILETLRESAGDRCYSPISKRTSVRAAQAANQTIEEHDPRSPAAMEYRALALAINQGANS